jgi:hypothetical protein
VQKHFLPKCFPTNSILECNSDILIYRPFLAITCARSVTMRTNIVQHQTNTGKARPRSPMGSDSSAIFMASAT